MGESKGYFVADQENSEAWIDSDWTCADMGIEDDGLDVLDE